MLQDVNINPPLPTNLKYQTLISCKEAQWQCSHRNPTRPGWFFPNNNIPTDITRRRHESRCPVNLCFEYFCRVFWGKSTQGVKIKYKQIFGIFTPRDFKKMCVLLTDTEAQTLCIINEPKPEMEITLLHHHIVTVYRWFVQITTATTKNK